MEVSMPTPRRRLPVMAMTVTLALAGAAWAQQQPASAPAARKNAPGMREPELAGTLTAKERLTGKAADEQRVDDCKVPPDKRGARLRPDACNHVGAGTR
jgi:hypothetical protein